MTKNPDEKFPDLKDCLNSKRQILPGEIVLGSIVDFDENSQPLIDYPENPNDTPQQAVSTQAIYKKHIGREAAILFANGDPTKPVIIGLIHNSLSEMLDNYTDVDVANQTPEETHISGDKLEDLTVDGKRIVIEGHEEIVLKCGASSITLTREGKILIRGKYLMNRSTGVNRILGGTVQIN